MLCLKIIICKLSNFILKVLGRGTSYPGYLALKLDKNILKKLEKPKLTICVTGTTGKTSICEILTTIYKKAGYKAKNNTKGSNLIQGVTSLFIDNTKINGKTKADVFVLEVDERYVKEVVKYFKPDYFIVNNLSRDQLARNGHSLLVWKEINNALDKDMKLVLNADDPLMYMLGDNHLGENIYYGLSKTKKSSKTTSYNLDISYCPKCHNKLKFDYFHFGNIGKYNCPKCEFKRPKVEYEASMINNNEFELKKQKIKLINDAIYNVYNMSAAFATASDTGVDEKIIAEALNDMKIKTKRVVCEKIHNHDVSLLLSKNEVPISYNQSIEYLRHDKSEKTVIIGFERISGRYDFKDISWIYDIDFESLNNQNISKILLVGPFANDLAVRLKYANIDTKSIVINEDSNSIIDFIKNEAIGNVYCIVYFDIFYKLKSLLVREAKNERN